MAKPISGALGYDKAADRPTVQLRSGVKKLKTEDDSGGGITSITSTDTSVTITNPSGPVVDLSVPAGTSLATAAPVNVTKAAAAVGTGTTAARDDHKHDVTTAAAGAATPGDGAAEGTATSLARSDHKHSLPAFGTTAGTFAQGNDARLNAATSLYWVDDGSYHADSDDFTEATLNARWTAVNHSALTTPVTPSGAIDSTTSPSSGVIRYGGGVRGTWGQLQFANTGDGGLVRKLGAGSRPAAYQIRWRAMAQGNNTTTMSSANLYFAPDNGSGTAPVITTAYLRLLIGNIGGVISAGVQEFQGGVQSQLVSFPLSVLGADWEFIVMQGTGTGAHVLIRTHNSLFFIPGSHGGTPATWDIPVSSGGVLWLYQRNINNTVTTPSQGSTVFANDYIRERRDNAVLP